MKRIPGTPGTSPEPLGSRGSPGHAPGTPGDPQARPWDTPGAPGTPKHATGTFGEVLETPQGRPWDPRDLQGGPQKQSYLDKYTAPEALDCCFQTCSLLPIA